MTTPKPIVPIFNVLGDGPIAHFIKENGKIYRFNSYESTLVKESVAVNEVEIDQITEVEISLNGTNFYSMDQIKDAIELSNKYKAMTAPMVEQYQRHDYREMFNIFKLIGGLDDQ